MCEGVGKGIYSEAIRRGKGNYDNIRESKMSDVEDAAMSGSNQEEDNIIQDELGKFMVNKEYKRLICMRMGCGVGLTLGSIKRHMAKCLTERLAVFGAKYQLSQPNSP